MREESSWENLPHLPSGLSASRQIMTAKKQKREFLHALPAPLFPLKEASLITLRAQAPENKRGGPEILKALAAK